MRPILSLAGLAGFLVLVTGCVPTDSPGLLGPSGANGPVDFPVWNGTDVQTHVAGTSDEAGTSDADTDTTITDTMDSAGRTENQGGSTLAQARQIIADDRWDLLNPDDVQILTDLVVSANGLANAAITDAEAAAFVAMLDEYSAHTQRLFENVVQTNVKFPVLVPISAAAQAVVDILADTERLETTLQDAATT